MAVLTRYIVVEVIKGSTVALLVLLTIFQLFTFTEQLSFLGKGGYGLKQLNLKGLEKN